MLEWIQEDEDGNDTGTLTGYDFHHYENTRKMHSSRQSARCRDMRRSGVRDIRMRRETVQP